MLALPLEGEKGRINWPRIGGNGWCGIPAGEVQRLTIVRISLARTMLNGRMAFLCQHCLNTHHAGQGLFSDLFAMEMA